MTQIDVTQKQSASSKRRHSRRAPRRSKTADVGELRGYVRSLYNSAPLDEADRRDVLRKLSGPDADVAREQLISSHLRLVVSVARRCTRPGTDVMDLIAAGNAGLVKAAQRYDPTRGVTFSTYAMPWIQFSIQNEASRDHDIISVPGRLRKQIGAYKRMVAQGEAPLQPGEVAQRLGISRDQAALVVQTSVRHRLNPIVGGESGDSVNPLATICAGADADPTQSVGADEEMQRLRSVIASLPPKERQILSMRFGLDGERPMSCEAIAVRTSTPLVSVIATLRRVMDLLQRRLASRAAS